MRRLRSGSARLEFVGWLLGLLTAFVWPAVSTQRQTVVILSSGRGPNSTGDVASLADDGWIVTRTDHAGSTPIVHLERPRYLAVVEQAQIWWWDLTNRR